jgi:hypothetical protein
MLNPDLNVIVDRETNIIISNRFFKNLYREKKNLCHGAHIFCLLGICRNWQLYTLPPSYPPIFITVTMPPRTRFNKQSVTRKRQASNVDETANKRSKTNDNGSEDDQKKTKKKQPKGRTRQRYFLYIHIL